MWTWVSINPGRMVNRGKSYVAVSAVPSPTLRIREPSTATTALRSTPPLPSRTAPARIAMDCCALTDAAMPKNPTSPASAAHGAVKVDRMHIGYPALIPYPPPLGGARMPAAQTYSAGAPSRRRLLHDGRECLQFTDVARIVLDDDGGFEIRRDLLEAIDRSQCRRAVGVECGHTIAFVIFPEVLEIATEQHVARLSQPDQQAVMAGRVSRRVQHD